MSFDQDKKQRIAESISKKGGVKNSCSRCNSQNFTVLDGYFRFESQDNMSDVVMGGPNIPSYGMACESCGNLEFFAAKIITPEEF